MMGSPYYYDVLFDDVVFHDCMWSGICTCCIQLLHQDSYYYSDSPDLKLELSHTHTQFDKQFLNNVSQTHPPQAAATAKGSANSQLDNVGLTSADCLRESPASCQLTQHQHQHQHQHQQQQHIQQTSTKGQSLAGLSSDLAGSQATTDCEPHTTATLTTTTSSAAATAAPLADSSALVEPIASPSTTPKPVRRREHNDSERKRRDHLRNAFNFLRDQVPRFKAINKKPPRIQILHEATLYVQRIMKESQDLERRLEEERTKYERLAY